MATADKKVTTPNWVLTIADITKEPEGRKYPPEIFTYATKEFNAWTRDQKISHADILAIKALRRRIKNRFYARDCRARRQKPNLNSLPPSA